MNLFKSWIVETIKRTQQPGSPYFKYWGKINVILMILAGLPTALVAFDKFFEVEYFNDAVPHPYWIRMGLKILFGAGVWGKLITGTSVKNTHEIVQEGDVLIQQTSPGLPFTDKKSGVQLVEVK